MNIYEKIRVDIGGMVDTGVHFNAMQVAESIGKTLGLNETMIQYTHIELRNYVFEPAYKKIPYNERLLFLPHCSRNTEKCKAKFDDEGYHCVNCGGCGLGVAKKIAEEIGYKKVVIAPGGTMVKKIIEKYQPRAVVGVCCFNEALLAFDMLKETNIIPQAVLLWKDGCKDTVLNLPQIEEKLKLIDPELITKPTKKTRVKKIVKK